MRTKSRPATTFVRCNPNARTIARPARPAVELLGFAVLDDLARQTRERQEATAARRAQFTARHPFDLPVGRLVSGGAM
jgi:hypothetical protein